MPKEESQMFDFNIFKKKYGITPVDKIYSINQIEYIVNLILRKYRIKKAYLCGAYAGSKPDSHSVVRIDLESDKNSAQLNSLRAELARALKKEVCLKDLTGSRDKGRMLIYRRSAKPLSY